MAAEEMGPANMVMATLVPLTDASSATVASGKRSFKAMRSLPNIRSVDPAQKWMMTQPTTAPHPHPPSNGAGGRSDSGSDALEGRRGNL